MTVDLPSPQKRQTSLRETKANDVLHNTFLFELGASKIQQLGHRFDKRVKTLARANIEFLSQFVMSLGSELRNHRDMRYEFLTLCLCVSVRRRENQGKTQIVWAPARP